MTHAAGNGIGKLRDAMSGPVITPADADFDGARQVWNAGIDRRPAAIARCVSTADVVEATTYARDNSLEISVRAGAHNTAGMAVSDDGLMVDLSPLNAVKVDPVAGRATAGGGALLADLDAATQEYGLAVPAGLVSHTGVGGLTLGGGMGWLTRKLGLTIDNLLAAEVVTAAGQVLRVGGGASRPVLGDTRRWRQLRRRHLFRVRPARGSSCCELRAVLLAPGPGHGTATAGA
jgi:FAD/FMN-containing dehydrogenase